MVYSFKARLLKNANETLTSVTGHTPAVSEMAAEAVAPTSDEKAAQALEAKKVMHKKQVSSPTLEDLLTSLNFNSRKNRSDIDAVFDNICILRGAMDNAGTEQDYLQLAGYEAVSRELICRRARNVVVNTLATIEKASKVEINEKTDLKGFDAHIQFFVEKLSDVRKLVDSFMSNNQLTAEAPVKALK